MRLPILRGFRACLATVVCAAGTIALHAEAPSAALLARADAGDAAAAVEVAGTYLGNKSEADYVLAARYLEKALAANPRAPNAQAMLALLLHQGRGVPMDRARARTMIESGAAAGDSAMQELAAELKKRGHLNTLLRLAAPEPELLEKAENGDAVAQWQLAQAYRNGWIDYPKGQFPAPAWTERAAQGGSADAQYFMAEGFGAGAYGFPKDFSRQRLWLERAVAQKHPPALRRIAELIAEGKNGFSRDEKKALAFARDAVAAGFKDAEGIAGALQLKLAATEAERLEAANLLNSAERRGDLAARRVLSVELATGRLTGSEPKQLRRILDQGVQDGDWRAKARLGLLLYEGKSLPKDESHAVALLGEVADKQLVPIAADVLVRYFRSAAEAADKANQSDRAVAAFSYYLSAVVLYGLSGQGEARAQAAQALTEFKTPSKLWPANAAEKRLPNHYMDALALVRIYQSEGGRDAKALGWLRSTEEEFRAMGWKNRMGQTAGQMIDEVEAKFRQRLAERPAL